MHRISTDADYLKTGKVVIDADGIPVDVPDRTHMEAAVTDLSSQISGKTDKSYVDSEVADARWLHPIRLVGDATNIDTLTNEGDQGMYVCASNVAGLPVAQSGWLTVYHERVTGRATQIYISSYQDHTGQWVRKTDHTGSEWLAWEHFNPRKIAQDVEDASWVHPIRLATADTIDTLTNEDDQHMYVCASTVTGLPVQEGGWVTVYHERVTGRTTQIYISSHQDYPGEWVRKTDITGSEWLAWEHFNPRKLADLSSQMDGKTDKSYVDGKADEARWLHPIRLASGTNIDDLTTEEDQGVYVCASTVAGLPVVQGGWVTVYHERVTGRTTQIYISSSDNEPGEWVRKTNLSGSEWGEWERYNPRKLARDLEDLKAQVEATVPEENGGDSTRDTLVHLGHAATPWETANLAATYDQGELYIDQVVAQVPFTRKYTIGHSTLGKPISALRLGHGGKPIVFIDCAAHGDEISSREAMFIWAKMSASRRPEWMEHVTAYVVPTLNTDRINIRRYNGNGDDINRDYVDQQTPEAQAIVAAVQEQQPIFYATCHEYRWDSTGDQGILMEPTNVAWLPDETVKTVSGRLYDEIGAHLVENGGDYGPYPQIFNEGEEPVQAHYYMSSVLNIPSLLIEGPGVLESHHGLQTGVHPRRYQPDLGERIHDYMLVFDQIMVTMSDIVQEREAESGI